MQPTDQQRTEWEERFERLGEMTVRSDLQIRNGVGIGVSGDAMHKAAFDWLRRKESDRERRDRLSYAYTKWTLIAAVVAVVVGIGGIIVTLLH